MMLWDSVVSGLKVLTYWQTYLAGLEYLVLYIVPVILLARLVGHRSTNIAIKYIGMLLMPVAQVVALVVFILTMATIIFGFNADAAWAFPWNVMMKAPNAFFILVGVLIIISFVLSFLPVLGRFHSLQTLVLGGFALVFVLSTFESVNPVNSSVRFDIIPGIWFSMGLMAVGGITSWVGTLVSARMVAAVTFTDERIGQFIMIPVSAIFGFIPLFMYGAWLGAQVRGGF